MKQRRRQLSYSAMLAKWDRWQRPTVELDGKFWDKIYQGHHKEVQDVDTEFICKA